MTCSPAPSLGLVFASPAQAGAAQHSDDATRGPAVGQRIPVDQPVLASHARPRPCPVVKFGHELSARSSGNVHCTVLSPLAPLTPRMCTPRGWLHSELSLCSGPCTVHPLPAFCDVRSATNLPRQFAASQSGCLISATRVVCVRSLLVAPHFSTNINKLSADFEILVFLPRFEHAPMAQESPAQACIDGQRAVQGR